MDYINAHLGALDWLRRNGYSIGEYNVRILAAEPYEQLADRVASAVKGVPVQRERLRHQYYHGIRFMIDVCAPDGAQIPLIDGGAFDWLRKLASNNKLVFVASGMIAQLFRS